MMRLAEEIYSYPDRDLAGFNRNAIEHIATWLELDATFAVSSDLSITGSGTQRLIDICRHFDASEYVTGHGARQYLDHEMFEASGIAVSYMDYQLLPYEQLYGEFTPYVSILDAIANVGEKCRELLASSGVDWRKFLAMQHASENRPEPL
jgi:hypothetical protein